VIQLLQWLQCFTSLGEDHESLVGTLTQLQRLSPTQLIHAVKNYRPEVGEKGLPKVHMKFLVQLQKGQETLIRRPLTPLPADLTPSASGAATPVASPHETTSAPKQNGTDTPTKTQTPTSATSPLSPSQTPTPLAPSITQPLESDSYPLGKKKPNHNRPFTDAAIQSADIDGHAHHLRRRDWRYEPREGEEIYPDSADRSA